MAQNYEKEPIATKKRVKKQRIMPNIKGYLLIANKKSRMPILELVSCHS